MRLYSLTIMALLAIGGIVLADACGGNTPTSSRHEAGQVENAQARYVRTVPVPSFQFPTERYMIQQLYIARNNAVQTYSFVRSPFTGKVLWSCSSIGFPIPYSTQMTNPMTPLNPDYHDSALIPQPEPNGVYPPSGAMGTWVLCTNADGTISPSYQEPNVESYLTPMKEVKVDSSYVLVPSGAPTLKIQPKR